MKLAKLDMDGITMVTAVALPRCQKLMRFFSTVGLHTPFFGPGDDHGGMVGLLSRFSFGRLSVSDLPIPLL